MNLRTLSGNELAPVLPQLAQLRIDIFSAYPYLYKGSLAYEAEYLQAFSGATHAIIVVAETDTGEIIGCATGSAITEHHSEFSEPLARAGISLSGMFYFGESVLVPVWRGQGIGHSFFDAREDFARSQGYAQACFCAVERPANHPKRPSDYSPLDSFWTRRGYIRRPDIQARFDWPEEEGAPSQPHTMTYWINDLQKQ